MSDPGLYATLYGHLHDCAELIDDVIVDLETAGCTRGAQQRKMLSFLLRALETAPSSDIGAALLWNVLRANNGPRHADWTEIADAIDRGDATGYVISRLEELAQVLEVERAEINARMRGSNAR
ncbi:MAG: hypothetical protein F4X40_06455 [Chloroflexi bacterium]|nr:hypothetical protein [Chloroflexota bacterium]